MTESNFKIYPYRWVVLAVFMLINIMVQVLWICYAPIASSAAGSYGVKREDIDLLANLFMLIYLPMAFPAAWAIDHFGFKKAVGFGAVLMAVFGLLRALFPFNYPVALVGSIGIAVGQPFPSQCLHQTRGALVSAKAKGHDHGGHFSRDVSRDRSRRSTGSRPRCALSNSRACR